MQKPKILVVDDEQDTCDAIANFIFKRFLCEVEKASCGTEALEKLKKDKFDVVILDIKMPGLSSIDVIREAVKFTPETEILAISAYDSEDVASQALKAGAVDYIPKPQTAESIGLKVKDILTRIGKYQLKKS